MRSISEISENLLDPASLGIVVIEDFMSPTALAVAQVEAIDDSWLKFRDKHETFINQRGIRIVQNLDVFAVKLTTGNPEPLE